MRTFAQIIKSNGTLTSITNKTTNTSSLAWGVFTSSSQELIDKAKQAGYKVFTNKPTKAISALVGCCYFDCKIFGIGLLYCRIRYGNHK